MKGDIRKLPYGASEGVLCPSGGFFLSALSAFEISKKKGLRKLVNAYSQK
jgi:hypothetical protein